MHANQQNQTIGAIAAALIGIAVGGGILLAPVEAPIVQYFRQLAIVQSR